MWTLTSYGWATLSNKRKRKKLATCWRSSFSFLLNSYVNKQLHTPPAKAMLPLAYLPTTMNWYLLTLWAEISPSFPVLLFVSYLVTTVTKVNSAHNVRRNELFLLLLDLMGCLGKQPFSKILYKFLFILFLEWNILIVSRKWSFSLPQRFTELDWKYLLMNWTRECPWWPGAHVLSLSRPSVKPA